jgi:6-pyruvoyltetrahydropterin/6-carboxytetrahydropterin synthase
MFRLTREVRFAINAAPPRQAEPTNSYAGFPSINGLAHYFTLAVTVAGDLQPDSHYLLNIKDIDRRVREQAVPIVAGAVRGAPQMFGAPTLAAVYDALTGGWPGGATVERLALALSPLTTLCCLAEERPMTRLSQKFEFSASHRLHNPALSPERNRETFGKCNNPHGHGHNYELEVTLVGTPADDTGLLIDVPAFESIVARKVIDRFDHKNLNVELPEFAQTIPSVENIAKVIHGLLKGELKTGRTRLASVTVWETPKTWCEYSE